jgi:AcrR family transcriptional regulator
MPAPGRSGRTGRRPGESGTREAILAAGRRQFAELGFDRTSMRQVALEAGVDPTLVSHFFGSKQGLFLAVVELPFSPEQVLPQLLSGDPEQAGRRLATFALGVLESEEGRGRVLGLLRAATSEPEAARLIRDLLTEKLLTPVAEAIGAGDARYRANLAMSQMVGIALARYLIGVEPLASKPVAEVIDAVGPTLQRYLSGPLGPPSADHELT